MERVAAAFAASGCRVEVLLPWIEADPLAMLEEALDPPPDLVGFSLRNMDDALTVQSELGPGDVDTHSYLPEVQPLVACAVQAVGLESVIVGGAGLSSGPRPVLRALGARWGVRGAAEDLCTALGAALAKGPLDLAEVDDPRVVRADGEGPLHGSGEVPRGLVPGWAPPSMPAPRVAHHASLTRARGGWMPVQISVGCDRRCSFCVEPRFHGGTVVLRPVAEIVAEVDALQADGHSRIWLGCSELNVPDARHATEVLGALAGRGLELQSFLQVAPVDDALLDALEGAGVDPCELSFEFGHLDDRVLRAGGGPANLAQIHALVETFLRRGYRTMMASVLFGAHPMETAETLQAALAEAREIDAALPGGLNLAYACGGRVYPESHLADWVAEHWEEASTHLYGHPMQPIDRSFARPVIFCQPLAPRAMLAHVKRELADCRGETGPMNADAPVRPEDRRAERWVDRGIWRMHQGDVEGAESCFGHALNQVPNHLDGLAQLAMLQSRHTGQVDEARRTLGRLLAALGPEDARCTEVLAALDQLSSPE
jgi:hypothetical protein